MAKIQNSLNNISQSVMSYLSLFSPGMDNLKIYTFEHCACEKLAK